MQRSIERRPGLLTPARPQLHEVQRRGAAQLLPGGHAPDAHKLQEQEPVG